MMRPLTCTGRSWSMEETHSARENLTAISGCCWASWGRTIDQSTSKKKEDSRRLFPLPSPLNFDAAALPKRAITCLVPGIRFIAH